MSQINTVKLALMARETMGNKMQEKGTGQLAIDYNADGSEIFINANINTEDKIHLICAIAHALEIPVPLMLAIAMHYHDEEKEN